MDWGQFCAAAADSRLAGLEIDSVYNPVLSQRMSPVNPELAVAARAELVRQGLEVPCVGVEAGPDGGGGPRRDRRRPGGRRQPAGALRGGPHRQQRQRRRPGEAGPPGGGRGARRGGAAAGEQRRHGRHPAGWWRCWTTSPATTWPPAGACSTPACAPRKVPADHHQPGGLRPPRPRQRRLRRQQEPRGGPRAHRRGGPAPPGPDGRPALGELRRLPLPPVGPPVVRGLRGPGDDFDPLRRHHVRLRREARRQNLYYSQTARASTCGRRTSSSTAPSPRCWTGWWRSSRTSTALSTPPWTTPGPTASSGTTWTSSPGASSPWG